MLLSLFKYFVYSINAKQILFLNCLPLSDCTNPIANENGSIIDNTLRCYLFIYFFLPIKNPAEPADFLRGIGSLPHRLCRPWEDFRICRLYSPQKAKTSYNVSRDLESEESPYLDIILKSNLTQRVLLVRVSSLGQTDMFDNYLY